LHQPLWFLGEEEEGGEKGSLALPHDDCGKSAVNAIRAVLTKSKEAGDHVRLVLSGGTHNFQLFEPIARNRPVQLVAGTGGARLDPVNQKNPNETVRALSSLWSYGVEGKVMGISTHGFVTLRAARSPIRIRNQPLARKLRLIEIEAVHRSRQLYDGRQAAPPKPRPRQVQLAA